MTAASTVLAVDGGNSKTDLVLATRDGSLLALVNGPTISHQQVPLVDAMARLADLTAEARRQAGIANARAAIGVHCLAGADFASDVRTLRHAIGRLELSDRVIVRNDAFAALRAGTQQGWGIAVVCGAGVNAVGVDSRDRAARLAGIGDLTGDWGGGYGLGLAALGAAVRARDGRGAATSLSRIVPQHFGLSRPIDVSRSVYEGRIESRRLEELAPRLFAAATEGDAVARSIVDRLADELARMAVAVGRRLRVARQEVEVVLTGGVFHATDAEFYRRIGDGVREAMPRAQIARLMDRPVLGAALIGLDMLGASALAEERLRAAVRARSH